MNVEVYIVGGILAVAIVLFVTEWVRVDLVALMVMGFEGYRFRDFAKVGFVLMLLVMAVVLIVLPLVWPLKG